MPADKILLYEDYRDEPVPILQESHLSYEEWLRFQYSLYQNDEIPQMPATPAIEVDAVVNAGRWIWRCESCGSAMPVAASVKPRVTRFAHPSICAPCGGDGWVRVRFPQQRQEIEAELLKQPGRRLFAPIRQWKPGWELSYLEERTAKAEQLKAQGVKSPRALSIGATRNWSIGETLFAFNMNTFISDPIDDEAGRNGRVDLENAMRVKDGTGHTTQPYLDLSQDYLGLPQRSSDPTGASGRMFYHTGRTQLRLYTGGSWQDLKDIAEVRPGLIVRYPGTTAPPGYLRCDGSLLSRTTYADLFAVLGTVYGTGAGNLYSINTDDDHLYQVDVVTPANSVDLGELPSGSWLALGGLGEILYGIENSSNHLYQVDVVTPANSVDLGELSSGVWEALGGLGTILYAIESNSNHLYQVDVVTPANSVDLGAAPDLFRSLGSVGNILYALQAITFSLTYLYQVDVVTPADSVRITIGTLPDGLLSLAGLDNILYGINVLNDNLYQIDVVDPSDSVILGSIQSGVFQALGGIDTVSDSFRLPSISPPESGIIAIIKT